MTDRLVLDSLQRRSSYRYYFMIERTPREFTERRSLVIGIISDTHGLLRSEALDNLKDSDLILHGGDVGSEEILARLSDIAPVFTVRGNVDYQPWCDRLPPSLFLRLSELNVFMVHDISGWSNYQSERVDLVVYGHSHRPEVKEQGGVVFINPGSAGPRRFSLPITLGKLYWEKGKKNVPQLIHLD
jgi:uncharacterized protein